MLRALPRDEALRRRRTTLTRAPLRHVLALARRASSRRPARCGCTSAGRRSTRAPTSATRGRSSSACGFAPGCGDGLRGAARAQHHRHQRQDLRRRAGCERRARRARDRRGISRTRAISGSACPTMLPKATESVPEIVRVHRGADRARQCLRGDRATSTSGSRAFPEYGRLSGPAARPGRAGRGAERAEGGSPRLRALEGEQARDRGHVVGLAVGPRPAGLAHRVLGDGGGDLRPCVRDPRRRPRPRLPASRERGRAVARARTSVRRDLDAQRDAALHRREDVEVGRQRRDDSRDDRRVGAGGGARLLPHRALAQADRLLAGDDGAGRCPPGHAEERVHASRRRA